MTGKKRKSGWIHSDLLRQKREKVATRLQELQNVAIHSEPMRYVVNRNRRLVQAELVEWLDSLLLAFCDKIE